MQAILLPVFLSTFLVLGLCSITPKGTAARPVLLIASLVCFSIISLPGVVTLLAFSVVIYIGGIRIGRVTSLVYYLILIASLGPLVVYRIATSEDLYRGELLYILGISYFTFNGISYLVDIRRGYVRPSKS